MRRSPAVNASSSNAPADRRSIRKVVHEPFAVDVAPSVRETATTEAPLMSAAFEMLTPSGEDAPMITTRRPKRLILARLPSVSDDASMGAGRTVE